MYTIFNCAVDGCESAQDTISVKIKDGDSGSYNEVYSVTGRTKDTQWNRVEFTFTLTNTVAYVSE